MDVGTGSSSLKFFTQKLNCSKWTAVTADPNYHSQLKKQFESKMRIEDQLLLGDWMNSSSLEEVGNQKYDLVLVDYVFAAMEYFSPFTQEKLMQRLKPHIKQYVYLTGQEPYRLHFDPSPISSPFYSSSPSSSQGNARDVAMNIFKLRDACQLLAGRRFYRFLFSYSFFFFFSIMRNEHQFF